MVRFAECIPKLPTSVKKGNDFMLLSTKTLKFLEAPTSLDNFLKAFGCSQTKGMFPYEWLDSVDKLSLTHLPPQKVAFVAE